jgi:hypothetical protein
MDHLGGDGAYKKSQKILVKPVAGLPPGFEKSSLFLFGGCRRIGGVTQKV